MTIDQLENKINDLKNNSINKNMFEVSKDILEQINYFISKAFILLVYMNKNSQCVVFILSFKKKESIFY